MSNIKFSKQHSLILFVALALLLHWSLLALAIASVIPHAVAVFLGSWSPNLAAFIVLGLVLKKEKGIQMLIGGWGRWKVGLVWYLVALSPIAVAVLILSWSLAVGNLAVITGQPLTLPGFLFVLVGTLVTGAMGEELGWRGFFLPRLERRCSTLVASLVVGAIWALWHLPLWFVPGQAYAETPFWGFAISAIASSIIFTWVVDSTGGSMVMASLMHLSQNLGINIVVGMFGVAPAEYTVLSAFIYVGYAILVVALTKPSMHTTDIQSKAAK